LEVLPTKDSNNSLSGVLDFQGAVQVAEKILGFQRHIAAVELKLE
jgi:hypothetical protein